jgi:cystathionine beta-lyase
MAKKIDTALVHAGRNGTKSYGYVNPPLVRGSTVLYPDMATKLAVGRRRREPVDIYGTHGTATHFALQAAVAEVEGGTHCQVVGSGLAAVTVPLLAYLRSGEHMLVPDSRFRTSPCWPGSPMARAPNCSWTIPGGC